MSVGTYGSGNWKGDMRGGKSYKVERMTENRRLESRKENTKSEVTREINQKSMYKNATIK